MILSSDSLSNTTDVSLWDAECALTLNETIFHLQSKNRETDLFKFLTNLLFIE